jgi:hypothetical protein
MKTYKIKFLGVTIGSIGHQRTFAETVQGENFYEAKLKLYDTHEHIMVLEVNGEKYDYTDPKTFNDKTYEP